MTLRFRPGDVIDLASWYADRDTAKALIVCVCGVGDDAVRLTVVFIGRAVRKNIIVPCDVSSDLVPVLHRACTVSKQNSVILGA